MSNRIAPTDWRTLVRIFEADGFEIDRQASSHIIMVKANVDRPLVIPRYKTVGVHIIRANLRTARMSRDRYFELLTGL